MTGPVLSDQDFFQLLSDDLAKVKEAAAKGDYSAARSLFASYIRSFLDRKRFFTIPYETPENIYKLPGESDSEACRRIEDYKLVSVGVLGDFSKERRVGWTANPTYNGYREWTWQLNRHNEIKMMAHEYNLTHDDRIAETAIAIMRSWIEDCPVPPIGTIGWHTECWRTIECGIRMGANWPYILFTFIDHPSFDDAMVTLWFKSVYEHAIRLKNDHMMGNWLIMEMNGLAHIAMLFPFFKEAGEWFDYAIRTLEEQLDVQFYKDGFQYELTTNYHDVVVNNYQRLFETAQAFSVGLPDSLKAKLLEACRLNIRLMMPDGKLPDINDGRRWDCAEILAPKSRFFKDDTIEWVVSGREKGNAPDYTSITLPWSGFAVFRSGWGEDDVYGFLDAAPFGKAHQHEDKLNFLLYGAGRFLISEGGNYAYDESPMRRYILSTRSHNTIRVDGSDQDRRSAYKWNDEDITKHSGLKSNIPNEGIEWAEGVYDEAYKDVNDRVVHTRRVIFVRKYHTFIILDRLEAEKEHVYQSLFHIDDELVSGTDFENLRVFIPTEAEISIVRGREEGEVQGFIALGQEQGNYKSVNCLTIEKKGKDTSLVTVFQPKDGSSALLDVALSDGHITLTFEDGTTIVPME